MGDLEATWDMAISLGTLRRWFMSRNQKDKKEIVIQRDWKGPCQAKNHKHQSLDVWTQLLVLPMCCLFINTMSFDTCPGNQPCPQCGATRLIENESGRGSETVGCNRWGWSSSPKTTVWVPALPITTVGSQQAMWRLQGCFFFYKVGLNHRIVVKIKHHKASWSAQMTFHYSPTDYLLLVNRNHALPPAPTSNSVC